MFVRAIADGTLFLILLLALPIIFLAIRRSFWQSVPVLIMAGITSLLIGKTMSLAYQPAVARPFLELGVTPGAAYIDNPGFPSDHALLATVTVLAVYAVSRNKMLTSILVSLLVVMSIGRVAALVHTPLDVAAGVIAGLSGGVWYRKLTK